MANCSRHTGGQTDILEDTKIDEPARYRVMLHNDDFTTMDFVVDILCRIFHKDREKAMAIMYEVHTRGIGQCGIYTKEIAEAKVVKVHRDAQNAGYPLRCTMEKI